MNILMVLFCATLLGVTTTIWCYEGTTHQAINTALFIFLTTVWVMISFYEKD